MKQFALGAAAGFCFLLYFVGLALYFGGIQ